MGLAQISTDTISSAVSSVTLTGIDSDDVYVVAFSNVGVNTDSSYVLCQVGTTGGASTTDYARAEKVLKSNTDFQNNSSNSTIECQLCYFIGNATNEKGNGIIYLYNMYNASEYSFGTVETVYMNASDNGWGLAGGFVHKVAEQNDRFVFKNSGSNTLTSGTFTLYKVV
tara:strand:- start:1119 stop:1625 length:507 start_codon:yes stop_codon:yes gene_type:complete